MPEITTPTILYPLIFELSPVGRAEEAAAGFAKEWPQKQIVKTIQEIRLELDEPTQSVRDMLDCQASENELREYLRLVSEHLERSLA